MKQFRTLWQVIRHTLSRTQRSNQRHVQRIAPLCLVIVCSLMVCVSATATAQQTNEQRKLVAVMNIINLFLLDRLPPIDRPSGTGVKLELHEESPQEFVVSDNLFAEFDVQPVSVELCFFIDSAQLIQANALTVEVNGDARAAYYGENCIEVSAGEQRDINYINLIVHQPGLNVTLSTLELQPSNQTQLQLPRLTRGGWDEQAVRKVLKVFAFGGHASDTQIFTWASMKPAEAIQEMLNFDEHNLLLSPLAPGEQYSESASIAGKLLDWQNFISDETSNLPIPPANRSQYGLNGYNFDDAYNRMITVRGLNPFRQRVGFWETNYHLATNLDVGVSRHQMAVYYDQIMEAHEAGLPYHEVLGIAAKSAAVAEQYGHDRNQWRFDSQLGEYICACNDDFAREIHQLFYGIFGIDDPDHHESVTIPNTARMLTDMDIDDTGVAVEFDTNRHYSGANGEPELSILHHIIPHSATADLKIDYLMPLSIEHPEALQNLPIMIIEGLADNNLSESKKNQLRASWASMGSNKNFLQFVQAYAISELFHSSSQFRYFTTHERALYLANKYNHTNIEAYFGGGTYNNGRLGLSVGGVISADNAGEFFRPIHNVFGAQSPQESADSALAFENNFNRFTEGEYSVIRTVGCDQCDLGLAWEKPWASVLPRRPDGNFYVSDVAEWLWNHVIGSQSNYTELERAHLYSILGAARRRPDHRDHQNHWLDFTMLMCIVRDYQREDPSPNLSLDYILTTAMHQYCSYYQKNPDGYDADEIVDINHSYTGQEIADDPVIQSLLSELGAETLPLEASGDEQSDRLRIRALERISNAIMFIYNTPFVFAEGQ